VVLVAEPTTDVSQPLQRFTAGDPLRALAALGVVLLHAAQLQSIDTDGAYGNLAGRAFTALPVAVNVFFVLSGYLVARSFVRAYLDGSSQPPLRRYLRRRALRILPAYWVALTVLLWLKGTQGASPEEVLGTYLLLQDLLTLPTNTLFLQIWSVAVEVGFYLLVPLAALALAAGTRQASRTDRARALAVGLLAAWLLSTLVRAQIPQTFGPFGSLGLSLPACLWGFMPGVALALLEQLPRRVPRRRPLVRMLPLALLALAAGGYATLMALNASVTLERSGTVVLAATLFSAAAIAAPLVLQWSGRRCWRWLDNRPLQWLGVRSYSLFLIHAAVIDALTDPVLDRASGWAALGLLLALVLPASVLLAHASYELVERPFLERRLPWRRRVPAAVATA
jgi:peptidoglycan/LPS O-acetylase OafA/YrhL